MEGLMNRYLEGQPMPGYVMSFADGFLSPVVSVCATFANGRTDEQIPGRTANARLCNELC